MTDKYDLLITEDYEKNGEKKTAFNKVGVAFPMRNGDGFVVKLWSPPMTLLLKKAKEWDKKGGDNSSPALPDDFDSDLPF
jgi:hypothetical protein